MLLRYSNSDSFIIILSNVRQLIPTDSGDLNDKFFIFLPPRF